MFPIVVVGDYNVCNQSLIGPTMSRGFVSQWRDEDSLPSDELFTVVLLFPMVSLDGFF